MKYFSLDADATVNKWINIAWFLNISHLAGHYKKMDLTTLVSLFVRFKEKISKSLFLFDDKYQILSSDNF